MKCVKAFTALAASIALAAAAFSLLQKTSPVQAAPQAAATAPATIPALVDQNVNVAWKLSAGNRASGSSINMTDPCIQGGVLYVGDDAGILRAVNAADSSELWKHEHKGTANGRNGPLRIMAVQADDERVYFTSTKGLTTLNRTTGELLWTLEIPAGGASEKSGATWTPSNSFFIGGTDGVIYALNAKTGDKKWTRNIIEDAPPEPANLRGRSGTDYAKSARPTGATTDGTTLYQSIFNQCRVVALDCKTGERRWSFQTGGWISPAPAVTDDFVLVVSQDSQVYCLDKESGKKIWNFATNSRVESAPTVVGSRVLAASCDGVVYCLDLLSGNLLWTCVTHPDRPSQTAIYSTPLVIKDVVYFATGEGRVYALSLESGIVLWRTRPSQQSELYSTIATDGRRLYVTSRAAIQGGRGGAGAPPPVYLGESAVHAITIPNVTIMH